MYVARGKLSYRLDARGLVRILKVIFERTHVDSPVAVGAARYFRRNLALDENQTVQLRLACLSDRPRLVFN